MHRLNRYAVVTGVLSHVQRKETDCTGGVRTESDTLGEHKRKPACASSIVATSNLYAKDLCRKVTFCLCVKQKRHQRDSSPSHHVRTENQESDHQYMGSAGAFMLAFPAYGPATANVCQPPAT